MRENAHFGILSKPGADGPDLFLLGAEGLDHRRQVIEYRHRIAADIHIPFHVRHCRGQQAVGLLADLVRNPVVDAQRARTAAHIDVQRFPRERLLEDTLVQVAGKGKCICAATA